MQISMIYNIFFIIKNMLIYMPIVFCSMLLILIISFSILYYKKHLYNKKICFEKEDFYIFKILNYIYIDDIVFEFCKLIINLTVSVGLIIFLRYFSLNKRFNIWEINQNYSNLSLSQIFFAILIIITLMIYLNISFKILKDNFFKIHLYMNQYQYYENISYFIWNNYITSSFNFTNHINVFINYIFDGKLSLAEFEPKYYVKFYNYVLNLNNTYKSFNKTLLLLEKIMHFLDRFINAFYHYTPHILVFIIFIYDLKNKEIKYFYYSIMVFMFIKFYRSLRTFIFRTDFHDIDKKLVEYYYKENIHQMFLNAKDKYKVLTKSLIGFEIYGAYSERIKVYFERGFVVDYITEEALHVKPSYQPYTTRFIVIAILILYVNFCYNMSLFNNIIITLPLILALITNEYYYHNKQNKLFIISKLLSYVLIIISLLIFLIIFLSRYTFKYITDIIDIKIYYLIQTFTVEEKYEYMKKYLDYILENSSLKEYDKTKILKIFDAFNLREILTENTSIMQAKAFVENFIAYYIKLEDIIKTSQKQLTLDYATYLENFENIFNFSFVTIIIVSYLIYIKSFK